jgi:hypothetical protein
MWHADLLGVDVPVMKTAGLCNKGRQCSANKVVRTLWLK